MRTNRFPPCARPLLARSGLSAGTVYYPSGAPLANPNLANTTTWLSEGLSSFNALEVDLSHRFSHGFQLRAAYTFSKSLDDGTAWNSSVGANAPGFVMYPTNPKWDWGLSTTDVRNVGVINATYELPIGAGKQLLRRAKGWQEKLAAGWTLTGIETIQSGFPFTPQLGFNPSNNGDSRNPVRPSWNPSFAGNVIEGGPNQYFNPNAFAIPVAGTYGNVGRDTLIGPGMADLDLAVIEEDHHLGETAASIPRRGLQRLQPGQFRNAECGSFRVGVIGSRADGGSHHLYGGDFQADSTRAELAMVINGQAGRSSPCRHGFQRGQDFREALIGRLGGRVYGNFGRAEAAHRDRRFP